jgi:hypothetical protein
VFEPGYEKLPLHSQYAKFVGLALLVVAVGLLIWPGAYHRIVEEGEDTEEMHRFTSAVLAVALMPFAFGLGLDFFVATEKVAGATMGVIAGLVTALIALFFWYGLEAIRKAKRKPVVKERQAMEESKESKGTEVKDKIKHVLTEARVVLPGAQALLGFQFATMLMDGFEKLPESSKYIHLASLAMVALTVVLLMTPAAYHRIVEQGEETEHFHRFSSRILIASMVPLALGIAGDLFVVARKVTGSSTFSITAASLMLVLFYGLWFGYTSYRRARREPPPVVVRSRETRTV